MGCFRFKSHPHDPDQPLPDQISLITNAQNFSGHLFVRKKGTWHSRLAVITSCGILVIYTERDSGKTYKLMNLKKLQVDSKKSDTTYVKIITCGDRKLELQLVDPQQTAWLSRILQPTGSRLGHSTHPVQLSPLSTDRFSYSLSLNSSEESIPRLLKSSTRLVAGKVHSILTDTTISGKERKDRLYAMAGSKREVSRSPLNNSTKE